MVQKVRFRASFKKKKFVLYFTIILLIVATRICSESADCLGSATVVGTGGDIVLEVHVLVSSVLKLGDLTLVNRAYQLTRTLIFLAWAETAESTSSTVEVGGRERL